MARLTISGDGVWVNTKRINPTMALSLRHSGEIECSEFARFVEKSSLYGYGFDKNASVYLDGVRLTSVESLVRLGALSPNYRPEDHRTNLVPSFEHDGDLLIRKQYVHGSIVDMEIPGYSGVKDMESSVQFIDDFLEHLGVFAGYYFYLYSWKGIRSAPPTVRLKRERLFLSSGSSEQDLKVVSDRPNTHPYAFLPTSELGGGY